MLYSFLVTEQLYFNGVSLVIRKIRQLATMLIALQQRYPLGYRVFLSTPGKLPFRKFKSASATREEIPLHP